eukprot:3254779-Alexandrium_andersonii.AAC.1
MSASLVGSEMCIRDRPSSLHRDLTGWGNAAPHGASIGRRRRGVLGTGVADAVYCSPLLSSAGIAATFGRSCFVRLQPGP